MLTHIFLMSLALLVCAGVAKLEKSNRLFWMLLVSMLIGYATAGILSYIEDDNQTQCSISIDNSTQTPTCSFQALLAEGDGTFIEIKSVGQRNAAYIEMLREETIPAFTHPVNMRNPTFIYDTS